MKKTPSTPECEEVLEELRKKYYNPREGSSKQYEYNNLNIQNVSTYLLFNLSENPLNIYFFVNNTKVA